MIAQRFQDPVMQQQYEDMVRNGVNWKSAEKKIIEIFDEYDNGEIN